MRAVTDCLPTGRATARVGRRAILAAAVAGALAGCSSPRPPAPAASAAAPTPLAGPSGPAGSALRWATWPTYIDVDEATGRHPTLDAFTKETGIDVAYSEVIEDNDEFLDSIATQLQARSDVGYDILTVTSWTTARLASAGQLRRFGPIDGADRVVPTLAKPEWDPAQDLSMPWQAGVTGIAYDARKVGRAIGSFGELFTRADLKGKVALLTEYVDTIGITLLSMGKRVGTTSARDIEAALDRIEEVNAAGQFAGFTGNEYVDKLIDGSLVACLAWSGDILQLQIDNPYLKFVFPEEGFVIWWDDLVVPAGSRRAADVARLASYYYQPEVAARVAAAVQYICPVKGAREAMEKIDPDLASNPLIFPDESVLDRSYYLPNLPTQDEDRLRARFRDLIGS